MAENKDNFSVESKPTHEHQPAQEATRHVDVCVIGAGLTAVSYTHLDVYKRQVYDMGNVPNKQRGTQDADAPYSFTTERRR